MISNKVFLTYKRKRLSSRSDQDLGFEGSTLSSKSPRRVQQKILTQKAESTTFDEKLNGEDACIVCNAGRSLLGCDRCSGTFHLQCAEPPLKYIPQGKWRCAACVDQHDSGRSLQQRVRESNRARKYRNIEGSEMGPMKLRSCKVLLVKKNLDRSSSSKTESSGMDASFNMKTESVDREYSLANSESAEQVICIEGRIGCPILDFNVEKTSSPACLDSGIAIKCSSGCPPEDPYLKKSIFGKSDLPLKLNNSTCSDMVQKKNTSTPLLTFRRRAKKLKGVGETDIQNNVMLEGKDAAVNDSGHVLHSRCKYEGTCHKYSPSNQPTDATVLQKDLMLSPLHVVGEDTTANIEAGAVPEASHGISLETKIVDNRSEGLPLHSIQRANIVHQSSLCSEPAECAQKDPTVKFTARCSSSDVLKDFPHEVMHEVKQSISPEVGTPVREESGVRSINSGEKPEGMIVLDDISKEGDSLINLEISAVPPTVNSLCSQALNKSSSDDLPANFLESQISPPSNHAIMSSDEEANGKGKKLAWLETIDEALQVPWKERMMCLSMGEGGINNCRQSSDKIASHLVTKSSHVHLPFEQEILAKSCNSGCKQMHHTPTNESSVCSNFLALSLPQAETVLHYSKDFLSAALLPNFRMKGIGYHNEKLPWQASEEKSLSRHKQVIDDILTGTRMLKQRQGYSLEKFKRFPSTWSEEELDSLWIGVRRYGRGNWHAMLRDPKLRFSEWRIAEDLAERWDAEQSKLLNGSLIQPVGLSKPVLSSSSIVSDSILAKSARSCYSTQSTSSLACSEFPTFATETNLSLGDVYLQQEKNMTSRNPFQLLGLATTGQHTFCSITGTRQQSPCTAPKTRFTWGSSNLQQGNGERPTTSHEHQPANLPTSSNLPHWLKEVFNVSPAPSEPVLPSGVSEATQSVRFHYDDHGEPSAPTKDQRRGILKRVAACGKSAGHQTTSNLSANSGESLMAKRLKHLPTLGLTSLNSEPLDRITYQNNVFESKQSALDSVGESNIVIIDSDASSEETISDDQSGKP